MSALFIFPAIWGCTEIVYEFLEATKVSISSTDMTPLFCFIFLTLYYFSHAMVLSRIKGRSPVKACFIYGLPAAAFSLSFSLYRLFTGLREGGGYTSIFNAAMFFALGAYAVAFITEMAFNAPTKDELKVIDGLPSAEEIGNEEKKYIKTESYDDLVFSDDKPAASKAESTDSSADESPEVEDIRPSEYYQNAQGLDDFIIGYQAPKDDEPVPYLTSKEREKTDDSGFVVGYSDSFRTAAEPKSEPAAETKPEPVAETKPEPVVEAKPEPVAEKKPVQEARPAPVKKSRSDVSDLLDELNSKI